MKKLGTTLELLQWKATNGVSDKGFGELPHAIDVMHLTKNFWVNLIAFLGVYGKTKDIVEARQELQRMEERDALLKSCQLYS